MGQHQFQAVYESTSAIANAIHSRHKASEGVLECLKSDDSFTRPRSIASDPALNSKFRHSATVKGQHFDIEVRLPGTLSLVRGDLEAKQVIFDGLCEGTPERLVVRVPAGYDLGGHLRAQKKFPDGYCRLLVPRGSIHTTCREGVIKILARSFVAA